MAIFSGKIKDAYYITSEYDTIEVIFEDEQDENLFHSHIIEVDESNHDYQDLVKEGYTSDKLIDTTAENNRRQSRDYNDAILQTAKSIVNDMLTKEKDKIVKETILKERKNLEKYEKNLEKYEDAKKKLKDPANILETLIEHNNDENYLFKNKLEIMKQFKEKIDPEKRRIISKSKSLFELYSHVNDLI